MLKHSVLKHKTLSVNHAEGFGPMLKHSVLKLCIFIYFFVVSFGTIL